MSATGAPQSLDIEDLGDSARRFVGDRQREMDDFILSSFTIDDNTFSPDSIFMPEGLEDDESMATREKTRPAVIPELALALHDDVPVSITIRTTHRSIINRQNTVLKTAKTLPPLQRFEGTPDDVQVTAVQVVPPPRITPEQSAKFRERFSAFQDKYEKLQQTLDKGLVELGLFSKAVQASDTLFHQHHDDVRHFGAHLEAMILALNEPLDDVTKLCDLPLSYQEVFRDKVAQFLSTWGWTSSRIFFEEVFGILERLKTSLNLMGLDRQTLLNDQVPLLIKKYRNLVDHVTNIVTVKLLPDGLGPGVKDLSSLVDAIKTRMDSVQHTFTFLNSLGETLVANEERLGTSAPDLYSKLEAIYISIYPLMDQYVENIQNAEQIVGAAHSALAPLHAQVVGLFEIVGNISDQCSVIERHLIAADNVRKLLRRLTISIGPFEGILNDLGIKRDANSVHGIDDTGPSATLDEVAERIDPDMIPWLLNMLPEISTGILDALIKTYFDVGDIRAGIQGCLTLIDNTALEGVDKFRSAVDTMIAMTASKKEVNFSVKTTSGDLTVTLPNTLMDDTSAKLVQELFASLSAMSKGVPVPGKADSTKPEDVILSRWARSDIMGEAIVDLQAITWGRAWDTEHNGRYPSEIWLEWYDTLERLDRVVEEGQLTRILRPPRFTFRSAAIGMDDSAFPRSGEADEWHQRFLTAPQKRDDIDLFVDRTVQFYQATIQRGVVLKLRERIEALIKGQVKMQDGTKILCLLSALESPSTRDDANKLAHADRLQPRLTGNEVVLDGFTVVKRSTEFYDRSSTYRDMRQLVDETATFAYIAWRAAQLFQGGTGGDIDKIAQWNGDSQPLDERHIFLALELLHDAYYWSIAKRMYFDLWRTADDDSDFLVKGLGGRVFGLGGYRVI